MQMSMLGMDFWFQALLIFSLLVSHQFHCFTDCLVLPGTIGSQSVQVLPIPACNAVGVQHGAPPFTSGLSRGVVE